MTPPVVSLELATIRYIPEIISSRSQFYFKNQQATKKNMLNYHHTEVYEFENR